MYRLLVDHMTEKRKLKELKIISRIIYEELNSTEIDLNSIRLLVDKQKYILDILKSPSK